MIATAVFALCASLRVSAAVNPGEAGPANTADEANYSTAVQQLTVTGTVTDADTQEPLPGVNIVIEGTTVGAITDADGNYSIDVPSESVVLVFSYVGYTTQRTEVSGRTQINIFLAPELKALEEVVVVGYGTQRREAVTGSVATMAGDEVRDVPSSNITQALQGRIAGVEMSQTSTKPGAEMQIRIRGSRSLNASNDPLLVLDGIPFGGSISDIDLNTVKSIDILKDASATAIYGSRGANGVILITTYRGVKGQKPQVSYNGYQGMQKVFAPYPMMDGPTFVKLRAAAGLYTNGVDESDDVNTDWQDLFYRTGMVTSHDLSIASGTTQGSYSVGTGYYRSEAVIPGQDYTRYRISGTIDQGVGKYFRFGLTTNNSYAVTNGFNFSLYGLLSSSSISDPYNADGTLKRTIKMPLDENWVYTRETMDALGDQYIDLSRSFGSYNNMYGELKIPGIEGLKYRITVGLNYRSNNDGAYTGEGVFSATATTPSTASIGNSLMTHWTIDNLLTYDRIFAEKHQLNLVGLYSAEQAKYNSSYISARNIPADAFQFYNIGRAPADDITIDPDNQNYWETGLKSWMGRVQYAYDNRYMLMASLRSDGSSRLAEGHKWHTYPAVSLGWNIGNESFMQSVGWIDMLKLRVGLGQTSNQAINPYATLGLLSTRPYNFGPTTYSTGYYVTQLPNPNLGWEYSKTTNFGVDFSVIKGRLTGTFEYYTTQTNDILLSVNLPNTSGVSSYTSNIGETQNKGVELSLNGRILNNLNGWTWDIGFNLYANRNELVALASGQERDEANWWFVGYPIDVIYDYEYVGLWQEGDPYLDILEPGGNVGMIKVKYDGDYNPDGTPTRQIGPDDRQVMSLEPNFQGGFNTRVAYKGFDLSAVGIFKSGGTLISSLYAANGYLNLMTGRRGNVDVDWWTPQNTGSRYPAPDGVLSNDNPKYGSTLGYFDASYLKVKTLSLGYDFGQVDWVRNNGIGRLRLYVMLQNPLVIFSPYHKESGMDPETNSHSNENAAVPASDNLKRLLTIGTNTPSTRNYLIGLSLSF